MVSTKTCPIDLHRLSIISAGSWSANNVCEVSCVGSCLLIHAPFWCFLAVLQISIPFNRTVSMSVLRILTLLFYDTCFELWIFSKGRNTVCVLPIWVFIPISDHPWLSVMLFMYMKASTCSITSSSSVTCLVLVVLYLGILLSSVVNVEAYWYRVCCWYTGSFRLHLFVCMR